MEGREKSGGVEELESLGVGLDWMVVDGKGWAVAHIVGES